MIDPNDPTIYIVESGDNPSKIARKVVDDPSRWRQLVTANPSKKRDVSGGFAKMYASERLHLPESWVKVTSTAPSYNEAFNASVATNNANDYRTTAKVLLSDELQIKAFGAKLKGDSSKRQELANKLLSYAADLDKQKAETEKGLTGDPVFKKAADKIAQKTSEKPAEKPRPQDKKSKKPSKETPVAKAGIAGWIENLPTWAKWGIGIGAGIGILKALKGSPGEPRGKRAEFQKSE